MNSVRTITLLDFVEYLRVVIQIRDMQTKHDDLKIELTAAYSALGNIAIYAPAGSHLWRIARNALRKQRKS